MYLTSAVIVTVSMVALVGCMTSPAETACVGYPAQQIADKQLLLAQLREAIQNLESPDATQEEPVEIPNDVAWKLSESLKRSGRNGGPRRYDSYGVGGRFGRSVDRQMKMKSKMMMG